MQQPCKCISFILPEDGEIGIFTVSVAKFSKQTCPSTYEIRFHDGSDSMRYQRCFEMEALCTTISEVSDCLHLL